MAPPPLLPASPGQVWSPVFFDDFTSPNYALSTNFRHPMGSSKWAWDAASNKEVWWEPSCSLLVPDAASTTSRPSKPVLRVCVFSNWFHRIDRLATRQTFGYGYYEARLRFRGASGMHSAFWLLPEAMRDDPVAPGLIPGGVEVDVVEHRKEDAAGRDLSKQGNTAVHWGGYGGNHRSVGFELLALPGDPSVWATFGVWHFEGGIRWYWNGVVRKEVEVWSPVRNAMYFSTEVGVSGGWAGMDLASYGEREEPEGYIEVDYCGFWEQVAAEGDRGGNAGAGGLNGEEWESKDEDGGWNAGARDMTEGDGGVEAGDGGWEGEDCGLNCEDHGLNCRDGGLKGDDCRLNAGAGELEKEAGGLEGKDCGLIARAGELNEGARGFRDVAGGTKDKDCELNAGAGGLTGEDCGLNCEDRGLNDGAGGLKGEDCELKDDDCGLNAGAGELKE